MRTILNFILLTLLSLSTYAQTVYATEQTVDKVKVPGLALTLPIDEKSVDREWEPFLRTLGRPNSSRGVYRVANADIRAISAEPINMVSEVKGNKTSTTVFAAFDLGSGNFVKSGDAAYAAAETFLKDFATKAVYNATVRGAEDALSESQKNHQKMVQKGERLQRDIERNKREKEKLLKNIDENAKELEQLTKDVATNKTDQTTALTDMDAKMKNVETVKGKKQ
ncbi:MAG: hypothetical protein EAZ91_03240 [Cytophagales bacterium]|nr:MAG: hypothetical protein EAZ91_03240 [Cytophagales bacterium]